MSSIQSEYAWWEHPGRVCRDDERYADLGLIYSPTSAERQAGSPSRKEQIADMQEGCLHCPVYYECLSELETFPLHEFYGVRAGKRGKS